MVTVAALVIFPWYLQVEEITLPSCTRTKSLYLVVAKHLAANCQTWTITTTLARFTFGILDAANGFANLTQLINKFQLLLAILPLYRINNAP